jgi:outer membrane translocation and assembly module TamA
MEVAAVTPAAIPTSVMQEALRGIAAMNPAAKAHAEKSQTAKAHAEKNQTAKAHAEKSQTAKAHAEKSQTAKAHAEKSQTAKIRHAMSPDAKIRVGGADATRIDRGTERSMVPIGIPDPQTAARAMIAATDREDRATAIAIHDRNRRIASLVHA